MDGMGLNKKENEEFKSGKKAKAAKKQIKNADNDRDPLAFLKRAEEES